MSGEVVHLEIAGPVATITLDSPANRNALSRQLTTELEQRLRAARDDARVRVIILTGAGSVFCSGADLKEQRTANAAGERSGPGALVPILEILLDSPKPIVGRINGAARAGGLGLVAACDIAVAVDSATFAVSEVRVGVIPAIISVVLLPKIGRTRASELFLTAEPITASTAVAAGLLTSSAAPERLDEAVDGYVASLLKGAPGALQGAKELIRQVPLMERNHAFAAMVERSADYFASAEALEGMAAFAEKRQPRWQAD
ncbi:MAG TPA: enoyl-CoA hydratase-related protein [Tepidiformaceae bacterium]|nr:enoyl-CoA hydratase-related protein [Tepidiformaceae bacterium]